jgi:aminoacylase
MEDILVSRFREYIRINTMQPNPDYKAAEEFLQKYGEELELEFSRYECVSGKPCIVLTWKGSEPELPSILLNSHIDVVPVFPSQWDHEPFSAHKTEDGWIYGRGTQDMKCVGIWYMEAIRVLKQQVHLTKSFIFRRMLFFFSLQENKEFIEIRTKTNHPCFVGSR